MVEDAQYEHGKRIQGVLFNVSTKLKMATIGKTAFEDRKIRIPQGDADLREDLHKLKKNNRQQRPAAVYRRKRQQRSRRPNLGVLFSFNSRNGGGYATGQGVQP